MPRIQPRPGEWTAEELWALPEDGNRYEVVGGILAVTPSPSRDHQDAAGALYRALAPYLAAHRAGWVYMAPSDVVFSHRDVVEPDLYVAALVSGRRPRRLHDVSRLLLAVEVLSPATAERDRNEKRRLYQRHADEYWIVDLAARVVERWWPAAERPDVLDREIMWRPEGANEPLVIDLPSFFREVLEA